eukprot:gb/GFBE01035489.1/.p1 GENE.gb/GFBE01035489.1/~~gb/GFBE01035489.1/.p1  ORF type:complete len:297 (+),score=66.95 gb/GFBE01035489.1/:1-891(+)
MVAVEQQKQAHTAWLKQMFWKPAQGAGEKNSIHSTLKVGDVPEELRQWRIFEFADLLEQGLAPGPTSTFVEPADKEAKKDERLLVLSEPEKKSWTLTTEAGDSLLMAAARADGLGFDIFAKSEGESPRKALGPSFVLACNEQKNHWTLSSVRCEQCESRGTRLCGSRELARMSHYSEAVGEGNAFCMDVELPEVGEDGLSSVVCSVCSDPEADIGGCVLSTRRPKWNARQKTLTLDFRGRCSLASAKNFQLEAENDSSKVTLLFGKVEPNKFVLDYAFPLGMVQAFGTALTATHWK